MSCDNHPIHYDEEYCRAQGHEGLLAHGLQVLSFTAAGAGLFPHMIGEALIGFVEVQAKFLKAVYAGDTLYPALTVTELKPQRTTGVVTMQATVHNQKSDLVLDGRHVYLLRLKTVSERPFIRLAALASDRSAIARFVPRGAKASPRGC